jgi:prevent-host-death family protein
MKSIEVSPGNRQLRKVLTEAGADTVVLTDKGRPVAALVPIQGADAESLSLTTNPKFLKILRRSFRELERGNRVSLEEMKSRLGLSK